MTYDELFSLFARYINTVLQAEGVDFLYENEWRPEEWDVFVRLRAVADLLADAQTAASAEEWKRIYALMKPAETRTKGDA